MTIQTHILDRDSRCSRCGLNLAPLLHLEPAERTAPEPGDRIGVISGLRFTEDSAYRITKPGYDSNQLCEPKARAA